MFPVFVVLFSLTIAAGIFASVLWPSVWNDAEGAPAAGPEPVQYRHRVARPQPKPVLKPVCKKEKAVLPGLEPVRPPPLPQPLAAQSVRAPPAWAKSASAKEPDGGNEIEDEFGSSQPRN